MPLLILASTFFLIPIFEIYLLLKAGDHFGLWITIGLVVSTAVLGAWLVRRQGFTTWQRVQTNLNEGRIPAIEMMEGVALLIAGALLVTPGFFTDAVGFVLLTPPLRKLMIRFMIKRGAVVATSGVYTRGGAGSSTGSDPREGPTRRPSATQAGRTVEGEYREIK